MIDIAQLQPGASHPGTGPVLSGSEVGPSGLEVMHPGLRKVGQLTNFGLMSQHGGGTTSADPGEGGLSAEQDFLEGDVEEEVEDLAGMLKGNVFDDDDQTCTSQSCITWP